MALDRPNFIFINTDQQRFDSLGCYGSKIAKTPNIDRLALEGVRFDRCYTPNPVCMPARASWFTGQYPSHHGVWANGVPLNPESDLLQKRFNAAGYHTALMGKIHLDNVWLRTETHPSYGFQTLHECEGDPYCKDEYFQWLESHGLYEYYMEQFKQGGHKEKYVRDIPEDKHMNHWVTCHVEEYMDARKKDGQPFFVSVGFFDPHHPFDPCEPYASMFEHEDMPMPYYEEGEEEGYSPFAKQQFERLGSMCRDPEIIRKTVAAYHATVTHVDDMVGRIVKCMEELDLEKNTVIVFTSDHGEMLGDHGILHKGALFYEGAIRVPLIYRFPQHMNLRGVRNDFSSHIDLAPTLSELAQIEGPRLAQGGLLFDKEGQAAQPRESDYIMTEWREGPIKERGPYSVARCLMKDNWKLVHYPRCDHGELYNLDADPWEHQNLWSNSDYEPNRNELVAELHHNLFTSEPLPIKSDCF